MPAAIALSALFAGIGSVFAGCADTVSVAESPEQSGAPSGPPSGFSAPSEAGSALGLCPTSECPPERTTCPNTPFPCGVDLRSDDDNCGACGHHCPRPSDLAHSDPWSQDLDGLYMTTHCIDGACRPVCHSTPLTLRADCNGFIEDGCESDNYKDRKNCGECGVVCPDEHTCVEGKCVCEVLNSCGACGDVCPAPTGKRPFPFAWNAEYGCVEARCNEPVCMAGFADCDHDFRGDPDDPASDGCETYLAYDAMNCGACGRACGPGEYCQEGKCQCPCGEACYSDRLNTDVQNCGACARDCATELGSMPKDPHGGPTCNGGVCAYACDVDWADCDADLRNGCETYLTADPLDCGRCGVRCDGVDGQACVDGTCTMKECRIVQ